MKSKVGDIVWYELGTDQQQAKIIAIDGTTEAYIELLTGPQKGQKFHSPWGIISPLKHEPRKIIEYHNVVYQPKVEQFLDAGASSCHKNAFNFAITSDDPLVYVEGYVKLKPRNLIMGHAWVVEQDKTCAYELCQNLGLKVSGLALGETIPWGSVEYHGCEITKEEMLEKGRPPVLLDRDLALILEKIKASGAGS